MGCQTMTKSNPERLTYCLHKRCMQCHDIALARIEAQHIGGLLFEHGHNVSIVYRVHFFAHEKFRQEAQRNVIALQ
jgi:hypothetical protein